MRVNNGLSRTVHVEINTAHASNQTVIRSLRRQCIDSSFGSKRDKESVSL